jgi:thiamine-phosphate pyrophosphorylase
MAQAVAAAEGGAGWVQLRDKTLSDAEFAELARALIEALAPYDVPLILNDRVAVAIEIGAAGLHIGQSDGDPVAIRRRIGPDTILGLSIETEDQIAGVPPGIDYLGVGPIHATRSKPDHAAPIGHPGFARIVARTGLPCLAIGGITAADVPAIRSAGGAGLAVISAITRAPDMTRATRTLRNAWNDT